jgi:hypothetical protein
MTQVRPPFAIGQSDRQVNRGRSRTPFKENTESHMSDSGGDKVSQPYRKLTDLHYRYVSLRPSRAILFT